MGRIRIAQKAWDGNRAATEITETTVGIDLMWVEIDGHRFENIAGAKIESRHEDFSLPEITIAMFGAVEMVYLGADGQEIGRVHADPRDLVDNVYEYQTANPIPPETQLDAVLMQRDEALARCRQLQRQLDAVRDSRTARLV